METDPEAFDSEQAASRQRLIFASLAALLFMGLLLPYSGVVLPGVVIILLGLVGGTVLFIVSLRRVDIPLILLVGYMPFSRLLVGDFGGMSTGINMFNGLFLLIMIALTINRSDREISVVSGVDLLIIAYVLVALISLIRGGLVVGDGLLSILLIDFKRWISPIVLYFLVIRALDSPVLRRDIILIVIFTTILVGLHGLKEFYFDKGIVSSWEEVRINGIASQPNQLGAFFVYYLPISMAILYCNLNRIRYWAVLTAPILIVTRALMLTVSRGAFVAFGMAIANMLFYKNKIISVFILLACTVFIMFPEKLPETVTGRMTGTIQENAVVQEGGVEKRLETSARRRIYALEGGLAMIAEHPLLGLGHNMFPRMIMMYHPMITYQMDTHNTYLTLATEMGIPALLLFIFIFLVIFKHTYRVFKKSSSRFMSASALGYMSGLVGLGVSNIFGSRMEALEIAGWIWILAAVFVRESLEIKEAEYAAYEKKYEHVAEADR